MPMAVIPSFNAPARHLRHRCVDRGETFAAVFDDGCGGLAPELYLSATDGKG